MPPSHPIEVRTPLWAVAKRPHGITVPHTPAANKSAHIANRDFEITGAPLKTLLDLKPFGRDRRRKRNPSVHPYLSRFAVEYHEPHRVARSSSCSWAHFRAESDPVVASATRWWRRRHEEVCCSRVRGVRGDGGGGSGGR